MSSGDQYCDVDGCRLRFRDDGAGEAVVLVHGWPHDLDLWEPQVEQLAASFRVVRFDRRGFGLSSGRPSLEADAEDLLKLLDRLHVARAAIVGMSQGVRVALQVALLAPPRVSVLVLDGAPTLDGADIESELPFSRYRELLHTQGIGAFRREYRTHPFARLFTNDRRAHAILEQVLARYPARDLREGRPNDPIPDTSSLSTLRTPTLVLTGELDTPARQRAGAALHALLPNAERATIPAAGHMANLDNPPRYNEAVLQFLQRQFLAAA
jgi:pimeloyl-ACP methyl ester carboxylesterase